MGRLTTHVLDTNLGKPAAGLTIELWRMDGPEALIKTVATNADGRVDKPLLEGAELKSGVYELRFNVASYLRASGTSLASIPFLDVVPIRFGVADASQHYHVPLLVSAHGYATYRGS